MTKKNLRPQQVAPVQRDSTATSSVGEKGMVSSQTLMFRGYLPYLLK